MSLCMAKTKSNMTKPLRDLLSTKNSSMWGSAQQEAFHSVKQRLSSAPVLAFHHPSRPTVVSADSSLYGLGAVITKQCDGTWHPVAYCSCSLSTAEQRYAQIEKETTASTWVCNCFSGYPLGKQFHIETDHKPLVSLPGSKNLDELSMRIQRFGMPLMQYSYTISHVPGKQLTVADTLSQTPLHNSSDHTDFSNEVDAYVQSIPATACYQRGTSSR